MMMKKVARKCSKCGSGMNEGYLDVNDYYCSEDCLLEGNTIKQGKKYTLEDWEIDCEENPDSCYYTEWEDEDDFNYIQKGDVLYEVDDFSKLTYASYIIFENSSILLTATVNYDAHTEDGETVYHKGLDISWNHIYSSYFRERLEDYIKENRQLIEEKLLESKPFYPEVIIL